MRVWYENVKDGGSAVWGCPACNTGAWCSTASQARDEATTHARAHGQDDPLVARWQRGPKPDADTDARVVELRALGNSYRTIARLIGIGHSTVQKALERHRGTA